MTDEQERRAVAWLDAHPEVVEGRAAANAVLVANAHAMCVRAGIGNPLGQIVRMLASDLGEETRTTLIAFLTSPLPCATCGGKRVTPRGWEKVVNAHDLQPCPDCTDGTAGILLDQLERGSNG